MSRDSRRPDWSQSGRNELSLCKLSFFRFVVIIVKPAGATARTMLPRGARLPETLARVEADTERPLVDILPFVDLVTKRWTLWIDCVRKDMVSSVQ